jgi:hypothetical protein
MQERQNARIASGFAPSPTWERAGVRETPIPIPIPTPIPIPIPTPKPFWLRRGAEGKTDKGSRLSERSEFERDPVLTEHRRLPVAKRRDAASRVAFSLGFFTFGEAKEK